MLTRADPAWDYNPYADEDMTMEVAEPATTPWTHGEGQVPSRLRITAHAKAHHSHTCRFPQRARIRATAISTAGSPTREAGAC